MKLIETILDDPDRIKKVLDYLKMSKNSIGVSIGDKNGMRFHYVLIKRNKISEKLAKDITDVYPEINYTWLLTGEGNMLVSQGEAKEIKSTDNKHEDIPANTGYYFPDVSASAGLDNALENTELVKIPITIPNWGKDLMFVNIFGDSMYPKYCSGEIIGLKRIEYQYLNYGYAYVIIMNDGEVYLKYIKKGKDEEHLLLVSENKGYDPREFHISLIKSLFIVKGVITKVTM